MALLLMTSSERSLIYYRKSRLKNGPLMNCCINWVFLQNLAIHNSLKILIAKNEQNIARYNMAYIKCHSLSSPKYINSPSNSFRYNCHKMWSWSERGETILKIRREATFIKMINKLITNNLFKYLTICRKKTNSMVAFSHTSVPAIFR